MESEHRPLTAADVDAFVATPEAANAKAMSALLTVSHQAAAGLLVHALLVRDLGQAGLVDYDRLRREALARAEPLGPDVVVVIEGIFGGKPPPTLNVPSRAPFTMIRGGLTDRD